MAADRTQNLAVLEQTLPALTALAATLDDAALHYRTAPDEWSIREILAHLVDDEIYVMRLRVERIVKEDQPHLAPHDEKRWYASRNTTRDALDQLLDDFRVQRAASLSMLHMLREQDWARTGTQPEYGTFTAEEWLGHWVEHDTVHLEQIRENLETQRSQG
jgi:DinB superfamily